MIVKPKIITGGQTGVDQEALDFAIDYDFENGGFCPKGRICEAGVIPFKYHLTEIDSEEYIDRTRKNVLESDAVLIIHDNIELKDGVLSTIKFCKQFSKPYYLVNTEEELDSKQFNYWLPENKIKILNIAGNRASDNPELKGKIYLTLISLFNL